jgi:hypothetical protein
MLLAKNEKTELSLLPALVNRHGLITGATGTGKTLTMQAIAHRLSDLGVPVFMADVKGDFSGIARPGGANAKVLERFSSLKIKPEFACCPVEFWDLYGRSGSPVRATVSDMGPLLLGRMLGLNETQEGVLGLVFKIADDNGLLLLDLKDLRAMLQHVGDNAAQFKTQYGNVTGSSIGAIQRGLLALESQGAAQFFGEPMLEIADLMQVRGGKGVVNVLAADKLMNSPKLYSSFLLWLLAELFEQLPEIGDPEKPKLVFFFDEAHLLFNEAPKALVEKVEQVVRLIRSKGVGVYFVTQNPLDVPETVLGQLGNRVQHALRAFTPRDQKAVKAAAETFRPDPKLDTARAIQELGVGEALVSLLDDKGAPTIVQRAFIAPPRSRLGTITTVERGAILRASPCAGKYDALVDRESAFEQLGGGSAPKPSATPRTSGGGIAETLGSLFGGGSARPATRRGGQTMTDMVVKSVVRNVAGQIGRQIGTSIVRGVLGSILRR